MNSIFKPNSLIAETAATVKKRSFFKVALIFLLIYLIGSTAASVLLTTPMYIAISQDQEVVDAMNGDMTDPTEYTLNYSDAINNALTRLIEEMPVWLCILQLFATVATIIAVFIYCTKIEKRRLFTLGFAKQNAFMEYLFGLLIGLLMFSLAYGTILLSGEYKFVGFNQNASIVAIVLFFIGFIVQGASEEILLRGYFYVSSAASGNVPIAIFVSSALFAAMHISNPGISFMAVINLFLFGVFAALYFLRRGNIWGISAIHTIWNFAQGNIFGCKVSGMNMGETIFNTVETNGVLWSGGDFGPEGGIGVTVVLTIGIIVLTLMKNKDIDGFFIRSDVEFVSA